MIRGPTTVSRHAGRDDADLVRGRGLRDDVAAIRRVLPQLWPADDPALRRRVAFCLGFVAVSSLVTGTVPLLFARAVDAYAGRLDPWLAAPILALVAYAVAAWVGRLLGQLYFLAYGPIEQRIVRRVSRQFFDHLHRLSLRFHLGRQTGGLSDIQARGLGGIRSMLNDSVFQILPLAIEVATILAIVMTRLSPLYAGLVAATLAAFAAVMTRGADTLRANMRLMNRISARAHGQALDSLINYETVKYFGAEAAIARRYDDELAEVERLAGRALALRSASGMAQVTVLSVGLGVMLALGGRDIEAGRMTVGSLVLVNSYLLRLARPLEMMGRIFRAVRTALANIEQLYQLLDETPEIRDAPDARPLPPGPGALAFEAVTFAYDERRPVLRDASFTVPAGSTLAVVGASGAGKSTLARLLFRFYDPTAGRILIDGADIRTVTQASLRAAIAVVPQDTVLFNSTLYDNIAFARVDATPDDVDAAAAAAQLDHFVASLPDGWDTLVGERGLKLSGGEKQRVAIARAILKRPRLFVFDEATSALDSATEQAIQAQIAAVAKSATTLIIAHRLSTVTHADRIIVLEHGRIVEHGRHAELVALGGRYADLWERQHRAGAVTR